MIQYLGLEFVRALPGGPGASPPSLRAVSVAADREARVVAEGSAAVGGVSAGTEGVLSVRPGEWVRAGCLAMRDAFFQIPARIRRVWGFALSGPPGWIALNPELKPLTPLWLTSEPRAGLERWYGENPRERAHTYAVLSPKDYFRYAVSGALAVDVTQAEGFSPLLAGSTNWSTPHLEEAGFHSSWFPPVFDSPVPTGRLSEEGIRQTGLPGGLWLVAGAASGLGPLIAALDPRSGALLVSSRGDGRVEIRTLVAGAAARTPPDGFTASRGLLPGRIVLSRAFAPPAEEAAAAGAVRLALEESIAALGAAGPEIPPARKIAVDFRPGAKPPWLDLILREAPLPAALAPFAGGEDPGTAFLCGLAQRGYRSGEDLHRRIQESREEAASSSSRPGLPTPSDRGPSEI